jgi:TfoX/Sxy family transcriptional regulator of competence genes
MKTKQQLYMKVYQEENRERVNANTRAWYERNKEERKATMREYYAKKKLIT